MSKRRHNFGTKRFKEKSLFIFHARIALKSLILLFVRLIARGARIGKTHTHTHTHTDRQTDRTSTVTLAHARRGLMTNQVQWNLSYPAAMGPDYGQISETAGYVNRQIVIECTYTMYK